MILSKKFFTKMSLSKTPEKGSEMKERDTRKKMNANWLKGVWKWIEGGKSYEWGRGSASSCMSPKWHTTQDHTNWCIAVKSVAHHCEPPVLPSGAGQPHTSSQTPFPDQTCIIIIIIIIITIIINIIRQIRFSLRLSAGDWTVTNMIAGFVNGISPK